MAHVTRVTGATTRHMARVPSGTSMEISTRAAGLMIRPTVTEHTHMPMVQGIKATGRTIYSMAMALRSGPMDPSMRVIMCKDVSTAMDHTLGKMAASTQVTGSKTRSMEEAHTNGSMAASIRANG